MWKAPFLALWEALKYQWAPVVSLFYWIIHRRMPDVWLPYWRALKTGILLLLLSLLFTVFLYFLLQFAIFTRRKYVYYRLIPPEKGKYQVGLWWTLIQHLNSETTPKMGFLAFFRMPPDYSFTFSKSGLILMAPASEEERVKTILARQSMGNKLFVYERIRTDKPPFRFKKALIRWIKRNLKKYVMNKDYQPTEAIIEKHVEKQAVEDPTEAIVERFAEFIVQKDQAAVAYIASLRGKGQLQISWLPLWHFSIWFFPFRLLHNLQRLRNKATGQIPELALVRIRIEQEEEGVIDSALVGEELGFNWKFPLFAQYVWQWLWKKRANIGTFGTFFFEKFSILYPQEIAIWARLPIRFSPELLAGNKLPESLMGEAVFKVPWGEPVDDFLIGEDALCHEWRLQYVIDGLSNEPFDIRDANDNYENEQLTYQQGHQQEQQV